MSKFASRKFIIALIFAVSGSAALFLTDKIGGGEFVTLALGLAGLFNVTDAAINAIHKRNSEE